MSIAVHEIQARIEADSSTRFNIYQSVHKGLRAFMSDTLCRVGRTDYTDPVERQECADALRSLLRLCHEHLGHENHFIHVAMERRCPGSSVQGTDEHVGHEAAIARLHAALDHALQAHPSAQALAWQQLYQSLSLFVAENHEHMVLEERDHNAVLWQHFSDEELIEIHDALIATIPAVEMAIHLQWMLPQLSHPERVAMLGGMRQGMPAEVFAAQLQVVQPLLDARSWLKLAAALEVGGVHHTGEAV